MSTTADVTLVTGTAGPGAFVPYTGTFAFSTGGSTTSFAAETFIGQILNNGNTNWVAGPSSQPFYLLTSSANGATVTTLADGNIYYYTQGPRPVFQEGVSGGGSASTGSNTGSSTIISTTAATSGTGVTVISGTSTSAGSSASRSESAAASSSTTSSSGASSVGVTLSGVLALGLMAFACAL